jgi:hypothetical protein
MRLGADEPFADRADRLGHRPGRDRGARMDGRAGETGDERRRPAARTGMVGRGARLDAGGDRVKRPRGHGPARAWRARQRDRPGRGRRDGTVRDGVAAPRAAARGEGEGAAEPGCDPCSHRHAASVPRFPQAAVNPAFARRWAAGLRAAAAG